MCWLGDAVYCGEGGGIVVVGHIARHYIIRHFGSVGRFGIAPQKFLQEVYRTSERHLASLHPRNGAVVECSFLHVAVAVHAGGLVEGKRCGIIVVELQVALSKIEKGTLPHGRIFGGYRRQALDGLFVSTVLEVVESEQVHG